MTRRQAIAPACLAAALLFGRCARHREFENWNPTVPGTHFKTIGTVAGSGVPADIRMTAQVRERLQKAGVNAVRRSGRWDSIAAAVAELCAPGSDYPVDGVLTVTYNRLVLYDCASNRPAYEIQSSPQEGGLGLTQLTERLLKYLVGKD